MTYPKMKPCPQCKRTDYLNIYEYESGRKYVECDGHACNYRGPGDFSILRAIRNHNAGVCNGAQMSNHTEHSGDNSNRSPA
jgi:hypothetical protein